MQSFGLKEIPLEKIDIGPYQARKREVDKNLDRLTLSIKKIGLLYPILVYEKEGRYKTIDGQRRVSAFEELGKETISALVIPKPKEDLMEKAISLSATYIHEPLVREDTIDVVTDLFDKYGNVKSIVEEYGIREKDVRDLIGIGVAKSIAPELYKWFEERRTEKGAKDTVLRALKGSRRPDGSIDKEKALELAPKIYPLLAEQQEEAVKVAAESPNLSVDDAVEKGKEAPMQITTIVSYEIYQRFEKRIKEEDLSKSAGARKAIDEWCTI